MNNGNEQIIINKNEYNNNFDNSDLEDYFIIEYEPLNIQDKNIKSFLRKNTNEIQLYKNKIAFLKFVLFSLLLILVLLTYIN